MTTNFGKRLAEQIRATGITQTELARRLDCSTAAVSQWISSTHDPRYKMMIAIANALGVDITVLVRPEKRRRTRAKAKVAK